MALTAEQQAAIALNDSKLIRAGAGTGKTTVLTMRYLALLEKGFRPSEIVAITFTRKAARELRERIDQFLLDRAVTTGAQKWREARNQLISAPISTIHAFYSTILRCYPLEAELEPGFKVLDEVDTDVMLQRALSTLIIRGWQRQCPHLDLLSLLHGSGAAEGDGSLARQLRELYTQARNRGILLETIQLSEQYNSLPSWQESRDAYCQLMADEPQVASCLEARGKDSQEMKRIRQGLVEAGYQLAAVKTPRELLAMYSYLSRLISCKSGRLKEQKQFVVKATELLKQLLSAGGTPLLAEAVLALLRELEQVYSQVKQAQNGLDYADLQLKVWDLLRQNPDIAAELRAKYKVFLVDEFQDTDRLQEKIIRRLVEVDGIIPSGPPGRLFVVGDEKQSIYRFRGAEVQVFDDLRRDMVIRNPERELSITANYRSRYSLIELANKLFSPLMNQSAGIRYIPLTATRGKPGEISARIVYCQQKEDQSLAEAEANQLAALVREMVDNRQQLVTDENETPRPVEYGDIAVLLRARTHLKEYEHSLRAAGVPYVVVGGVGFYGQQEVLDVLNMLKVIANKFDRLSLVAVLRSPMFSLSDDSILAMCTASEANGSLLHSEPDLPREQSERLKWARHIIGQLRRQQFRLGIKELLEQILVLTHYREMILARVGGLQCYANVEKLLALAGDFEQLGSRRLGDFLTWVEQAAQQPESEGQVDSEKANTVRIMTIHASKGLEFPLVILPVCRSRLLTRPGQIGLEGGGLVFRQQWDCSIWNKYAERERQREIEEYKRLLYVALTRAEDWLVVLAGQPDRGKDPVSFNNWLRDFAAGEHGYLLPEGESGILSPGEQEFAASPFVLPAAGRGGNIAGIAPVGHGRRSLRYYNISQFLLWKHDRAAFERRHLTRWLAGGPDDSKEHQHDWEYEVGGAVFGSLLHRILEELASGADREAIISCLMPVYYPGADTAQHKKIAAAVGELIGNYCKQPPPMKYNNSESELEFYWRQGEALFYGLIDRLLIAEDLVAVIDFKTNRIPPEGKGKLAEYYAPQLQFYAMAASEIYKRPAKAWLQLLRLPPGQQLIEISLSPHRLQDLKLQLDQFLAYCNRQ